MTCAQTKFELQKVSVLHRFQDITIFHFPESEYMPHCSRTFSFSEFCSIGKVLFFGHHIWCWLGLVVLVRQRSGARFTKISYDKLRKNLG